MRIIKPFIRSDSAISTVVSVVLILGLIVTVLSIYQVYYIPAWKNDAEHSHMDDAWEDMADLKSKMDILSSILVINPETMMTMGVPLRMGGGVIPVIAPTKSSGTLTVNLNDFNMKVVAENGSGEVYDSDDDINNSLMNLGTISYQSINDYYINQLYEYENGALLVVQNNLSLIRLSPSIILKRVNATNISITINAVEVIGPGRCISSNTIEEIKLTSNASDELFSSQDLLTEVTITVNTVYPDAWEQYFNISAINGNLEYGSSEDYTLVSNISSVILEVTGGAGEDIQLDVNKIKIDTSIGNL